MRKARERASHAAAGAGPPRDPADDTHARRGGKPARGQRYQRERRQQPCYPPRYAPAHAPGYAHLDCTHQAVIRASGRPSLSVKAPVMIMIRSMIVQMPQPPAVSSINTPVPILPT